MTRSALQEVRNGLQEGAFHVIDSIPNDEYTKGLQAHMSDDYSDDLFGDLDLMEPVVEEKPKIKRSSSTGTSEAKQVDEAWSFWCVSTERPVQKNPERDFALTYRKALKTASHDQLLQLLDGASRSQPFANDVRDIRRAISALTTKAGKARAITLASKDASVIPFPELEIVEPKSTLEDLAEACGIKPKNLEKEIPDWVSDWTNSDHEASAKIMLEEDAESLMELGDAIGDFLMVPVLVPGDLLKHRSFARNYLMKDSGKEARNTKGDKAAASYKSGRVEQEVMAEVNFHADSMAERMLQRGISHETILEFHNRAPEGYWDAVIKMYVAGHGAMSLEDVYNELNRKFDWHPKSRF